MTTQFGFDFCLTDIRPIGVLPVPLIEGHEFRAATPNERSEIRNFLRALSHGIRMAIPIIYEHRVRQVSKGDGSFETYLDALPEPEWRYFGIGYQGSNEHIRDLEIAAALITPSLDLGVTLFGQNGEYIGTSWNPTDFPRVYLDGNQLSREPYEVQTTELAKIGEYRRKIAALLPTAAFVKGSLESFFALRALPDFSPLNVVGLFSIIEALTTHKPRLNESLDSINHQVRNKLVLLEKRFVRRAPFAEQFGSVKPEKLWKLLYSYRSAIAHGDSPEFTHEFRDLRSRKHVIDFLTFVVKELLIFSLDNHAFLADLKEC